MQIFVALTSFTAVSRDSLTTSARFQRAIFLLFYLFFFGEIERFPKGRGHHGHLLGSCKSHKVIVGTLKLKIKCYLAAQQNNEAFQ